MKNKHIILFVICCVFLFFLINETYSQNIKVKYLRKHIKIKNEKWEKPLLIKSNHRFYGYFKKKEPLYVIDTTNEILYLNVPYQKISAYSLKTAERLYNIWIEPYLHYIGEHNFKLKIYKNIIIFSSNSRLWILDKQLNLLGRYVDSLSNNYYNLQGFKYKIIKDSLLINVRYENKHKDLKKALIKYKLPYPIISKNKNFKQNKPIKIMLDSVFTTFTETKTTDDFFIEVFFAYTLENNFKDTIILHSWRGQWTKRGDTTKDMISIYRGDTFELFQEKVPYTIFKLKPNNSLHLILHPFPYKMMSYYDKHKQEYLSVYCFIYDYMVHSTNYFKINNNYIKDMEYDTRKIVLLKKNKNTIWQNIAEIKLQIQLFFRRLLLII